ncbi:MAG: SoxR reducing system RseC family protein [Candidatus Sulfobium sp.]|jgi:sigma-E factor negative regulatory protein RseC
MLKFYMVEEVGTVKSIDGVVATVEVPRKSMCDGCTAGCKQEDQCMEIEALNQAGARVGETVRVSVKSLTYLKGTVIVYGLPALALVLGAVIGKNVMSRVFPHADPDILSAVFGFGAFALSFVAVKVWTGVSSRKTESKPVIEEILK